MLRLTGLPAPARYPRASVRHAADRIEIVFSGEEGATLVDVDLRLLGPIDDLEAVQLDLTTDRPTDGPGGNSAFRLAAVHDRFTVPYGLRAQLGELTGPVLLVDDLVDSGWTLTWAGSLLRGAGSGPVHPFALAEAGGGDG